jgi:integrase/recombinase XerC/integrase/recombinase XerD
MEFYQELLSKGSTVIGLETDGSDIQAFIENLSCSPSGKHGYYRALRAFYNWLYSRKSGMGLNPQDNPILAVDAPKVPKKMLPSLTREQLDYLIEQAEGARDKAIISLFADSGLRVSELANINPANINWEARTIKVIVKGNKEGLAPFGPRTEELLRQWLAENKANGKLWDIGVWGIDMMLKRLRAKTGLKCNPHTFRRTFATLLAKQGIDSLHIMRLGRWESIQMVEHYTRSLKMEDSLKLYQAVVK